MGNFSFLLKNDEYESFSKPCIEAENMIATINCGYCLYGASCFRAGCPLDI